MAAGGTAMIMGLKQTSCAIALIVVMTSMGYAQAPQARENRDTPDFKVQVWGDIVTDFSTRVRSYFDLRSGLEEGLPALTVTSDAAEIRRAVRALAGRIRAARAGAKQGDIFFPK
jgi:hypothetical protein